MLKRVEEFLNKNRDYFYAAFRILVGLMFVQHGAQKLFGALGGTQVQTMLSLFGVAGFIEFFGGLLITFGLFTRVAAFFGIADMLGAWYIAHMPKGWIPIQNGGELAALYFAAFLVILSQGTGKFGLDNLFKKS